MELSISFLSENFDVINELFFDNGLIKPKFEITHVKSYLGQYHWRYDYMGNLIENVIRISDMYDLDSEKIVNILAHEMIHLYIRQNHIRDSRPHHGRVFYSVADRLNREGGFTISRTDSVVGYGLRSNNDKKVFYVCNFFSVRAKRYFQFVINKNCVEYYKKVFSYSPHYYLKPIIFKSTDDKAYAHYMECRKSLRGYYIDEEQYEINRELEDVIYSVEVLGVKHSAA